MVMSNEGAKKGRKRSFHLQKCFRRPRERGRRKEQGKTIGILSVRKGRRPREEAVESIKEEGKERKEERSSGHTQSGEGEKGIMWPQSLAMKGKERETEVSVEARKRLS
ncbi:Uncharacterized protein TCM_023671 [Theobroma cacao]|uniref:Uncharacterized protein n=1 Tax=Theobroma cacao TaxID=3641 RepID=A0A061EUF3_THECC|nr:Uncharacterized protein TCM_023671 [Theobroma cacao]